MAFNIFISHRHQDAHLAKALHDELRTWVDGRAEIYLSSLPGQGRPGNDLNAFLKDKLKETDLFILLFTLADEDWSFCMWELGVVTGADTKPTRVVVFSCANKQPKVRVADAAYNARESKSIMDFVTVFHTDRAWLIEHEETRAAAEPLFQVLNERNGEALPDRGERLSKALETHLPNADVKWNERLEYLALSLPKENVEQVVHLRRAAQAIDPDIERDDIADRVASATDTLSDFSDADVASREEVYAELRKAAKSILRSRLEVERVSGDRVADRFGFSADGFGEGTTLDDLLGAWSTEFARSHGHAPNGEERAWIDELLDDLSRATQGRRSRPSKWPMASPDKHNSGLVQPIVVRTKRRKDDGMDYHLYFFQAAGATADGSHVSDQ